MNKILFGILLSILLYPVTLFSQKTDAGNNIDIFYGRFFFYPSLTTYYIEATVTYYFKVKNTSDTITFDFSDTLSVDSIVVNGTVLDLSAYYISASVLHIYYPGMNAGETDSISIYYHGAPIPTNGEYPAYFFFYSIYG
jgi:hypothetical protein